MPRGIERARSLRVFVFELVCMRPTQPAYQAPPTSSNVSNRVSFEHAALSLPRSQHEMTVGLPSVAARSNRPFHSAIVTAEQPAVSRHCWTHADTRSHRLRFAESIWTPSGGPTLAAAGGKQFEKRCHTQARGEGRSNGS